MARDFYAVLGLPRNATAEQIRQRFLELARQRHPDRHQGAAKERAEAEFQQITEAFNVLSDGERRRQHDLELAQQQSGAQRAGGDAGQLAKAYLQRGIRAYRAGNCREAADNFDRATKTDPDNARAWHHLALACSHERRWLSRAIGAVTRACKLEPMNATYLKLGGRLFEAAGRAEQAEEYYNRALKWGGDQEVEQRLEALRKSSKRGLGLFGKGS
jgi:curved DNA-binding protein CbpA